VTGSIIRNMLILSPKKMKIQSHLTVSKLKKNLKKTLKKDNTLNDYSNLYTWNEPHQQLKRQSEKKFNFNT